MEPLFATILYGPGLLYLYSYTIFSLNSISSIVRDFFSPAIPVQSPLVTRRKKKKKNAHGLFCEKNILKVYMPQSPAKKNNNTKEDRAYIRSLSFSGFLASLQGWMFFSVSSSFSHLLIVAPPSIISACKVSLVCRDPDSGPQTAFQLCCPQLTGNFPLSLWIQVLEKEREANKERESLTQPAQPFKLCHQVIGHWKAYVRLCLNKVSVQSHSKQMLSQGQCSRATALLRKDGKWGQSLRRGYSNLGVRSHLPMATVCYFNLYTVVLVRPGGKFHSPLQQKKLRRFCNNHHHFNFIVIHL